MIVRSPSHDMIDRIDAADMIEKALAADPMEPIDANDPIDPTDSTLPTDPIDRIELRLPMLSSEFSDFQDHLELEDSASVMTLTLPTPPVRWSGR
jgi:hypothetical protein